MPPSSPLGGILLYLCCGMIKLADLLLEYTYRPPSSGITRFWDFYVIYTLWYQLGSGYHEYHNNLNQVIVPERRRQYIDDLMEQIARPLLKDLVEYLIKAAYGEFLHLNHYSEFPDCLEDNHPLHDKVYQFFYPKVTTESRDFEKADRRFISYEALSKRSGTHLDLKDLLGIFKSDCWWGEYGGEAWANAVTLILEIQKRGVESMPLKDLVVFVDKIYDMEHNTGAILNKGDLYVNKKELDVRHNMKDVQEVIQRVSPVIKNVILTSKSYLNRLMGRDNPPDVMSKFAIYVDGAVRLQVKATNERDAIRQGEDKFRDSYPDSEITVSQIS